ncbi:MAG TPA: polymer-forming cytoskeletal protein [Marinospirillum sp.]|uniref:bactofilin family protein n=1 Tax=Marinospirillum sp. TaxID=2183934 RepID=UPI002B4932DF|nr:polymer-forming cytoskeletal protein [Marinospirillum sp.]HKM14687.1 polymer-forming cytoskeletal protein [Marinospirillum sp.]
MFGKSSAPTNNFDTLISGKAEIVGDIHFSGGLHIDGKVYGNIIADDDSKAVLRISDKGSVEGEVSVPHLIVNGTIIGDVHSCEHLELAAKAVIKGNIFYNTLEMVMGSQVDGHLEHRYKSSKGSEKVKMPKQVTKEKPKSQLHIINESKVDVKPALDTVKK